MRAFACSSLLFLLVVGSVLAGCGQVKATPDAAPGVSDASPEDAPDAMVDAPTCAATEDCFNGLDDDCNGEIDCADTACTGGASPVAECVADPGSATSGYLASDDCPTTYPTETQLSSGLNAGTCTAGSCTCSGLTGGARCDATLQNPGGSGPMSCNTALGDAIFTNQSASAGCLAFTALGTDYYRLSITMVAQCNPPGGGTPTKNAPTWQTTKKFCSGAKIGVGCQAGAVCMPAAPKHCVIETGSQTECTRAGYGVPDATEYFTGFDDTSRSCSCACNVTGTCGTSVAFGVGGCTSTANLNTGCHLGFGGYDHAKVPIPSGAGCATGANTTGSTTTTGFERTLCCTN